MRRSSDENWAEIPFALPRLSAGEAEIFAQEGNAGASARSSPPRFCLRTVAVVDAPPPSGHAIVCALLSPPTFHPENCAAGGIFR